MCRWFAYISQTEPCLLEDVLITSKHSLCKQVHEHFLPGLVAHHPKDISKDPLITARNALHNTDGLGVAWYTSSSTDFGPNDTALDGSGFLARKGTRPAAYKTVTPPINDINFRSICANTETLVCFAHIRAASGSPIVHVNNHPFIFGRHTFMHNGVASDFGEIRREMCGMMSKAAYAGVLGSTDSEHLGALYMTYLTDHGDKGSFEEEYTASQMADAMHKAVAATISLQKKLLGEKTRPSSLNLCTTDGSKLVAYRFRNHASEQPPSLYFSTTAGTTLNRKYPDHPDGATEASKAPKKPSGKHGRHVIVASEPSTYKASEWTLLGRNQYLIAHGEDSSHEVTIADIPYDASWDAEDTS